MTKLDSRYLSYILRHHPEDIGLKLDEYGYARVDILCRKLHISKNELEQVVADNTRYIYNNDHTKIKAAHGHSIPIKYENEQEPPEFLYHGTADRFEESITKSGLIAMSRDRVHLSVSSIEAKRIGTRHTGGSESHVIVYIISAKKMYEDGYSFNKSEDGVWLTEKVPTKYMRVLKDNE